jgi:D-aminopeptidase
MAHGSGDYVITFSTAESVRVPHKADRQIRKLGLLRDEALSPLFQATREATEEAIINSLLRATTVTGFSGRTCEAIPVDQLVKICKLHRAIRP